MSPLVLTLWLGASAEPVVQPLEGATVDWGTGVLRARAASSGGGGPLANHRTLEQEAWLRLEALIAEQAAQVQVTAELTAGALMAGEDPLSLRLSEGLQTWRITTTRYLRSGQVELEAELVLHDWLRPALSGWAAERGAASGVGAPTGLVVDARGLAVQPAVVPRLVLADGQVVHGHGHLVQGRLADRPPAVWVTDPGTTEALVQAGERPEFVGARAVGQGSELVLAPADAEALARAEAALVGGGLVIVVDP